MANSKLLFFDKKGEPLNFEYVGPTGAGPADVNFLYVVNSDSSTKGNADLTSLESAKQITLNIKDVNGFDIIGWGNELEYYLTRGADVTVTISVLASSNRISGNLESVTVGSTTVKLFYKSLTGNTFIGDGKKLYFETSYKNRPGGYFKGSAYFDLVSAGLFENFQIYSLQEFREISEGPLVYGYPHADIDNTSKKIWRSRWDSNKYGNVDISNIIFTYKISENDLETGEPAIYNYPNVAYEVGDNSGDIYEDGFIITSNNIESHLSINVALNAIEIGSGIYERKLIIEELTDDGPVKVIEIDFYGEVIGADERLDILTRNLGRNFVAKDSTILRDHDPLEPLPDYIEINEKRKELMVAGEEIFPYIGSYKGLINAIKFFGYQDLRVKEYWLNIKYSSQTVTPLQENSEFLSEMNSSNGKYTQNVLIKDVLDNENTGKYKLTQTYGPNKDGDYVLDVSSGSTLVPSNTYKKTSFFGLYYDVNRPNGETDPYGYPILEDVFMFSQEEVILKLFALKERLKQTYLPLNARIIDITGEGVYYNVYNTRSWTDSVNRVDIDSGINPEIFINPDFGFIEDLSAFNTRPNTKSIQIPTNYDSIIELNFNIGGQGDSFRVAGYLGNNPTIILQKGKRYVISNTSSKYPLFITRSSSFTPEDPDGISTNGIISGEEIILDVQPGENIELYYYSAVNTTKLNGIITISPPAISDLGNISDPLANNQKYTSSQAVALIDSIGNFYRKKQDNEILELGDNRYDPPTFIDPKTGLSLPNPIGMPVIFELKLDETIWDDLDVTWDSLEIPVMKIGDSVRVKGDDSTGDYQFIDEIVEITDINYTTGLYSVNTSLGSRDFGETSLFSNKQNYSLLTWDNIDFSNYVDIEWTIIKDAEQEGSPYAFSFRGPITEFYKLPHFLPYTGTYKLTCNIYDSYNFRSSKIIDEAVVVSPRIIDIDAWTRYHENEEYSWDEMIRPWNDYKSIWQYPAEGNTYPEARKLLSEDALNFINYGNSAYEGQDVLVKVTSEGTPASAEFTFTQDDMIIESIKSYRVGSLAQYSIAEIRTTTPHNFEAGSIVYIRGSVEDVNGDWPITIPYGATGYTFTIPKVLEPQEGVAFSLAYLSVDPAFHPEQYVTGGGSIEVYVDNRIIADVQIDSEINSTVSGLISEINKTYTTPDYIASTDAYIASNGHIKVSSNDDSYSILNGTSFKVIANGSVTLISVVSELSGGVNPIEEYIKWTEESKELPNKNLKWWGTKRMSWDDFEDVTWDDMYAHTWDDFEFNNDWLGGFDLYGIKSGDYLKVSPSNESLPFPVGITFSGTSLTLGDVADQLNSSTDENITNFYYRTSPSDDYSGISTTSGPVEYNFSVVSGPTSGYPAPRTVPGANPVNSPDFTYST